jgi:hypothetical protein
MRTLANKRGEGSDVPLEVRHHGERGREREEVRVVRQDQVLEVRQAGHLHWYLSVLGVLASRRAGCSSRVPMRMWAGWAQSRFRCGRGGPSPYADVSGVGPVPVQLWELAKSRC